MRYLALLIVSLANGCAAHSPDPSGGAMTRITNDGAGTYTIELDHFTVAAGEERYACQDFANPFGAAEAGIARFVSHQTPGSHHLLLFYKTGATDAPLADCSGLEFAPGPYGSQRPDDEIDYPPGVAAVVSPGDGFRVQVHYLNATASPIDVSVRLELTRDDSYTDRAAILFFTNTDLHVPAGATGVVAEKTCTLPFAVNLLQSTGHMHRHGVSFQAVSGTQMLFESTSSSDVAPSLYAPPLALPAGAPVTFRCTYDNDGATPLQYGESALTDEMCIFTAQFYPAPFGGWTCF
jgi:hypothetical protein